jgi:hypothetical protein
VTSAEPDPLSLTSPGAEQPGDTPLFSTMAAAWEELGRTVPGRPDPEWERLVAGARKRRRRPAVPAALRPEPPDSD